MYYQLYYEIYNVSFSISSSSAFFEANDTLPNKWEFEELTFLRKKLFKNEQQHQQLIGVGVPNVGPLQTLKGLSKIRSSATKWLEEVLTKFYPEILHLPTFIIRSVSLKCQKVSNFRSLPHKQAKVLLSCRNVMLIQLKVRSVAYLCRF